MIAISWVTYRIVSVITITLVCAYVDGCADEYDC